ncbi:MAG TPA: phytanoyl-CoA dioxygenase family protein [Jatrophihabitans sp.]|uniref:phytanoyl-CoA dioxygenase family protein n=1 Tax=Jatrophihabitans sp. TaxID=1932789 RepID=UPI002EED616E
MILSDNEVTRFWRDGFLHKAKVIPAQVIDAVAADARRILPADDLRHVNVPTPLGIRVARAMAASVAVARTVTDPCLLTAIGQLVQSSVFVHPRWILRVSMPRVHGRFSMPPHQDFPFTQGALDTITCWIPLHEVPEESSPLMFVARSHQRGLWPIDHTRQRPVCDVSALDRVKWEVVPCAVGDIVLFHSLTVHASRRATDGLSRVSIDARYQATHDHISPVELTPMTDMQDVAVLQRDHGLAQRAADIGLRLRGPVPTDVLDVDLHESRLAERTTPREP